MISTIDVFLAFFLTFLFLGLCHALLSLQKSRSAKRTEPGTPTQTMPRGTIGGRGGGINDLVTFLQRLVKILAGLSAIGFILWFLYLGSIVAFVWFVIMSSERGEIESVEEARAWFDEHKNEVFEIRDILLEHPAIEWLEPDRPPEDFRTRREYTPADRLTYNEVAAKCRELGIIQIQAVWSWRDPEELDILSFFLYNKGTVLGRDSISIDFMPNPQTLAAIESVDPQASYQLLNEPAWYVEAVLEFR